MGATHTDSRLRALLGRMPPKILHVLSDLYHIAIPEDVSQYALPDYLVQELGPTQKAEIMSNYAYAGRAVCSFLGAKRKTDPLKELVSACENFPSRPEKIERPEPEVPLFDYYDIDEENESIRIRFRYFHELQSIYDQETRTVREQFPLYYGTVVVRPGRRLVEVRASSRRIVRPMVYRTMAAMKLSSIFRLDLYTEKFVPRFLEWINSLNNARLIFPEALDLSTISLSARRTVDLRTTQRFKELLREGYLRGAHVTIMRKEGPINFRIFFRDTRVTFTSFANEHDIQFVADGLEKISEGREFRGPTSILDKYLR